MKIAIYGSRRQQSALDPIAAFLGQLKERGIDAVMHRKLYNHLYESIPPQQLAAVRTVADNGLFDADLAVSLGGDGTFLRAAMWVGDKEIPIVGVNTGHLGYLTALSVDKLPQLLDSVEHDAFRIERRGLLQVVHPALPDYVGACALNEIAVSKVESSSMITAAVCIDGTELAEYRADGLIVCTSTGSTAYNLSVGGPIVQPTLDVTVISPVAAHSLSMRPLVVSADSEISIVPSARASHVRLSLDGRSSEIEVGSEICITRAPYKVLVVQPSERTFAETLRDKLHWGET